MVGDSSSRRVVRLSSYRSGRDDGAVASCGRDVLHGTGAPTLNEALPERAFDVAATAFVLASLPDGDRPVLWIRDRASQVEHGRLHLLGLGARRPGPVLSVRATHPRDVLWAMEEGAACSGLAAVVGEIHGAPAVLDFTATKRLAMRAEASKVPVWLIRSGDPGTLSAARARWRIGARPSDPHPHDPRAPGAAEWMADLFRARGRPPAAWRVRHDPDAADPSDRLRVVPAPGDGSLAGDDARGAGRLAR